MASGIPCSAPAFDASSHHGSTPRSIELSRLDGPSSVPATVTPNTTEEYDNQVEADSSSLRNESSLAPVDGGYRAWSFVR